MPESMNLFPEELEHLRQVVASLPKVEHRQCYPDSARELFDKIVTLKYNVQGTWRVQVELADGSRGIIAVGSRHDGELARVQIRGMALELLGHFLNSTHATWPQINLENGSVEWVASPLPGEDAKHET